MIIKNEIPILEHDTDPCAVIMPNHEHLNLNLPSRAVFPFLGETVEQYAQDHGAEIAGYFISSTKKYPIYLLSHRGEQVALVQAPVGSAAAVQIMDWMISYGSDKIISCGSCGALCPFEENMLMIPQKALRDEGASYHYLAPSRYVSVSAKGREAIGRALCERGLPCREVTTWSTDGFFRETAEKTDYRRQEGCSVVEMECAGLAACAQMRGAVWAELLFTADCLADCGRYAERNWGMDSHRLALDLCLDAVLYI